MRSGGSVMEESESCLVSIVARGVVPNGEGRIEGMVVGGGSGGGLTWGGGSGGGRPVWALEVICAFALFCLVASLCCGVSCALLPVCWCVSTEGCELGICAPAGL